VTFNSFKSMFRVPIIVECIYRHLERYTGLYIVHIETHPNIQV